MLSINEIKEKLQPLYDVVKNYCIGIVLIGSYVLPWIRNKHDIDVLVIFKDNMKYDLLTCYSENIALIRELQAQGITPLIRDFDRLLNQERCYVYENNFCIKLFESEPFNTSFDIFNKRYVNILKANFEYVSNEYQDKNQIPKFLYHILTGIYMIQNNSYELTEEQIENINIVHDMEDTEMIGELFNYCKEWLNNYE